MKFMSLYQGITLSIQGKCTKYTRVYKAIFYERFQFIMNHSFIFLITHELYIYIMHFI